MYDELNSLLILLCRSISARQLYFNDHPKVKRISTDFITNLHAFCKEAQIDKLFIGIIDDNLVFEGKNLIGPSIVGRQLIRFAEKLHCGGISFSEETTSTEFNAFLDLTIDLEEPTGSLKISRELLAERDIRNIEIAQHYSSPSGPMTRDQQTVWHGQDTGELIQSPTLIYQALFDSVAQAHGDVASGRDIDIDNTRSVSEYMLHFSRARFSDLMQHVHYPDSDSYTIGHSVRVASLCVFIGSTLKWPEEELLALATAGLLHDIGKSRVTDEILYKPGRLNTEEFEKVMAHSRLGAEILLAYKNTTPLDIAAAWGHHIRADGGGYPEQPKWAVRHPSTALLQICDAFEALTAVRPYKPILTPHTAYGIMLSDKGAFHPALLASFIKILGIYPPGNLVELSDGSTGLVASASGSIDRPIVYITHSPDGTEIPDDDRQIIDLSASQNRELIVEELLQPDRIS